MKRLLILLVTATLSALTTSTYATSIADTICARSSKCTTFIQTDFGKKKSKKDGFHFGGMQVGFVKTLAAPSAMKTEMASSFEIGFEPINYRLYTPSKKQYFSVGISFNWRNFRMTGKNRFIQADDDRLIIAPYPEQSYRTNYSRIKLFSLGFPLRWTFNLPKRWEVDLGATLNLNTHASASSFYRTKDAAMIPGQELCHKVEESYDNIHKRLVSVDFVGQVRWNWLGLYAKYSPCKVISKDYGPQFTPLSIGFSIFY